ncbi:MAG: type IV pilus secretin PilQ [Nitrospira sp.]|nr:type IV pilus secretin PilQ [Nitrospira sp.]
MSQKAKNKKQKAKMREQKTTLFYLFSVSLIAILFIGIGCATTGVEQQPSQLEKPNVITGIDLQDYAVTVTSDRPFTYTIYRSSDPYRMVVELLDVNIGAFNSKIASNKAGITEIIPSQVELPAFVAKLEMLLQTPSEVESEYKNNVLIIKIKKEEATEKKKLPAEESPDPELPPVPVEQKPLSKATEISSISFEKSEDILKVVIKGNGSIAPNVFPLDNRIVIDVPDVVMSAQIPTTVISPLKGIRSGKHMDKIRLVLDLKEMTNYDVASIEDSIVIALQRTEKEPPAPAPAMPPIAQKPEEKKEIAEAKETEALIEGKYTGKKISLDFQDADITPIFRLLSDISGYNIVVNPEVKGKITMKLINVPWDQALDIMLKTFSLGKTVEGNIIRVAPYTVFAKESEEAARAKEAEAKAEPLETKIFPISYADVTVVEKSIKDSKILTPRGSISVDKRTSSMVIKDIEAVFPQIENILATLDKPTPQVLIEARIVEINTKSERELGIQWGINYKAPNTLSAIGGSSGLGRGSFTGDNFLVDFPSAIGPGVGSGFNFGILSPDRTLGLDLQLSAIETTGNGKVISNPRIMTVDNGKARIAQGKSIPFTKQTAEGTTSEEFKDVTLELNVQPHITPDKSISISIEIKKEELDFSFISKEGTPSTDKKEAKTDVIIKDGETIVIGGIYKINTAEEEKGVPGLMKIPILGWLFKKEKTTVSTTELLVFITPRIVEKP